VAGLVPLLREKGFTFRPLGDATVDGRAARGVQVSSRGQPDVSLYFDKASGVLVKYASRLPQAGREVAHEVVLRDYRRGNSGRMEEQALKAVGVGTDGPALLKYLRERTPARDALARARALVAKLGAEEFAVRERAEADLLALGPVAVPVLREATKSGDLEKVRRAQRCLRKLGSVKGAEVTAAVARLLALRRTPGAVEALLGALPGADEPAAGDVRAALLALAVRDGRPDPALVKALKDPDPGRRAAAAAALGKDGGAYRDRPGRPLLTPGPRLPGKLITYVDGKAQMELEVIEVRYFNRIDAKEFARP
jgi:hypothetical protein